MQIAYRLGPAIGIERNEVTPSLLAQITGSTGDRFVCLFSSSYGLSDVSQLAQCEMVE
jgi:hypothetical protein